MIRIISIILFGLILSQSCFPQQQLFGSKISGNGDILSDVILIQDGFVLDSAFSHILDGIVDSNSLKYWFEYYEDGKLKRDIYSRALSVRELVNGLYVTKYLPGCYLYFYNEKGYIDSTIRQYWYDTVWVNDHSVDYSYDDNDNLLSKIYSGSEGILRTEKNSYDSLDNLILIEVAFLSSNDTTYIAREYDSQSRLTKVITRTGSIPVYSIQQKFYLYNSSENIDCLIQTIYYTTEIDSYYYYFKHSFEFDISDKLQRETRWFFNQSDSTWFQDYEVLLNYDEYGRIQKLSEYEFFHFNVEGNLDTMTVLHPVYSGYLGNKATLMDSYGNKIILTDYNGTTYFYYRKVTTGVEENNNNNIDFNLSQNYPNPFNPTTRIYYHLATEGHVALKVYDILGREIKELVNEFKTAGTYSIQFDGSNLSSGVYFYSITTGSNKLVKKMLLTK